MIVVLILSAVFIPVDVSAGPGLWALCSAGCATLVVACYSAAGFTFGTVTAGVGIPGAISNCNSAFGTCMKSCAVATAGPTP